MYDFTSTLSSVILKLNYSREKNDNLKYEVKLVIFYEKLSIFTPLISNSIISIIGILIKDRVITVDIAHHVLAAFNILLFYWLQKIIILNS